MNYFLLAETDFFRLINEAGDCNMETAYTAFATQVIELCNGGMDMNLTVIALAYIEIELQHHPVRNLSEEKREIAAYVSKALSFVRKMQKFLATPQVPPLISANNVLIVYFISFGGPRCPLFFIQCVPLCLCCRAQHAPPLPDALCNRCCRGCKCRPSTCLSVIHSSHLIRNSLQ